MHSRGVIAILFLTTPLKWLPEVMSSPDGVSVKLSILSEEERPQGRGEGKACRGFHGVSYRIASESFRNQNLQICVKIPSQNYRACLENVGSVQGPLVFKCYAKLHLILKT